MKTTRTQAAYLAVKIKSLAAEAVIIRKDERRHRASHKAAQALHAAPDLEDTGFSDRSKLKARSNSHRETWLGLKAHRRGTVRDEARAALLAYGFLRGAPYRSIEAKCHLPPDWDRVARIVTRFSMEKGAADAVVAWSEVVSEPMAAAA